MKVTFDKYGYVEMLIKEGDLPNSIELKDDDTIEKKYLACYKLGFDGTKLVLDAEKVQRLESNLKAETLVYDLKNQINSTDYKVLRHIREVSLGIPTSMSENEYLMLEAERESLVRRVREIEDGCKLEIDINAILQEGYELRQSQIEKNQSISDTVEITIPEIKEDIKSINNIMESAKETIEQNEEEIIEEDEDTVDFSEDE